MVRVLRSTGDIWIPTVIVTGGFWGVAVPVGYYAAFTLRWGVDGLLWEITAGAAAATLPLLFHFFRVTRGEIAPI